MMTELEKKLAKVFLYFLEKNNGHFDSRILSELHASGDLSKIE